jgi:acetyltransferase-like isoleucine patch superfamily enzyme
VERLRERVIPFLLRAIQFFDRQRLRLLVALHPGLEIDPSASSNLAHARYQLAPGARLCIGPGVVTERIRGALVFSLGVDATVEIGANAWLRTELGPVHVVAFDGARLTLGPEAFLNGCHLSAKQSLTLGRRAWVGPGSRVFDSDQHDFDAEHPEQPMPVVIGDHVWVASDVTVLRGVTIGEHSVIGARSLVTRDIPPHSLAFGQPATVRGRVGDRSRTR